MRIGLLIKIEKVKEYVIEQRKVIFFVFCQKL